MPPRRVRRKAAPRAQRGPGRLRRYLLLELPAWLLVGVSVAYAIAAGGGGFGAYFEFALLVSAVAWLLAGRMASGTWRSLLFGVALGTMALFNLLAGDFVGIPLGALLLPVTIYLGVVLVFLELDARLPGRAAAVIGVLLSAAVQLLALSFLLRHT
ncbi:MAG TPA: hypothetical protein VNG93_03440 [Candidatus Dormibacteraeota bacterium]|nr:hypothetical protein [Candidatus Dormibacteraeota bacterium]